MRNDIADEYGLRPVFPKPFPYRYSIRDVINLEKETTHDSETDQDLRLDNYAIGPEWDRLLPGEQSKKYFQLVKADINNPNNPNYKGRPENKHIE